MLANAAWTFAADDLADHIAFEWFRRSGRGLDHWYEEEEEIFIHPRDPHKRVDAMASSRHVQVEIDGMLVADTRHPVLLFETGLPTPVLHPARGRPPRPARTHRPPHRLPYKGTAQYWSWHAGADVPPNLVWSYPEPLPAVGPVQGLLAFFNETVDITVDGERLKPPSHRSVRCSTAQPTWASACSSSTPWPPGISLSTAGDTASWGCNQTRSRASCRGRQSPVTGTT